MNKEERKKLAQARVGPTKRKYISKPRCAAIWKSTGEQCIGYAREGKQYCVKHGTGTVPPGVFPAHVAEGRAAYWKRIKEAAQHDPTLLSRIHNPHHPPEHMEKMWKARDAAKARKDAGLAPLPKPPKPTGDEKLALRADKIITAEIAALPAVPDRPFSELEPHEQLVVVTGQALETVHEILAMPLKDEKGEINLKRAALKKDTAIRTLSIRVKVDTNALNARRQDKTLDLLERIRKEQEKGEGAKLVEGRVEKP